MSEQDEIVQITLHSQSGTLFLETNTNTRNIAFQEVIFDFVRGILYYELNIRLGKRSFEPVFNSAITTRFKCGRGQLEKPLGPYYLLLRENAEGDLVWEQRESPKNREPYPWELETVSKIIRPERNSEAT